MGNTGWVIKGFMWKVKTCSFCEIGRGRGLQTLCAYLGDYTILFLLVLYKSGVYVIAVSDGILNVNSELHVFYFFNRPYNLSLCIDL